jgi:hypothetical protein
LVDEAVIVVALDSVPPNFTSLPFSVKPLLAVVLSIPFGIVTAVPATPFTVVVKALVEVLNELATVFTAEAVAAIPFTVEVIVLVALDNVWVVAGILVKAVSVTKFPEASNPKNFVVKVPADGVNVAATPLVVLVMAFEAAVKVLVVAGSIVDTLFLANTPVVGFTTKTLSVLDPL